MHLASQLNKHGLAAVIVEAGGAGLGKFAAGSYRSVGRKHQGISIGRSKSIGGTTNLWGGQLVEFQPIDFTGRDWLPESRWPVGYEEIAPYYRQTYAAFGIGEAEQDDQQVWKAVGTPPAPLPGGLEVFLTRRLKVPSFSVYFADTINSSADILLLADHVAVGFDGSGTRVEAVKGRRPVADGATTGS